MRTVIGCLLALTVTASMAFAGPPIDGTYQSISLGGPMLDGRYSESWTAPNGALQIGNTTNKLSWDGATLGTQWWMYCAELSLPPTLILDTVDANGNGQKQYLTQYTGGICVLDGNGPWGDGSVSSYTALYTSYAEINTFQFSNFAVTGVTANVNMTAQFIGFADACMSLSISNQEQAPNGTTDSSALPADYPGFMTPSSCIATRTLGSWGESDEHTLIIIGCTVPTEDVTWGGIKALYEDE